MPNFGFGKLVMEFMNQAERPIILKYGLISCQISSITALSTIALLSRILSNPRQNACSVVDDTLC